MTDAIGLIGSLAKNTVLTQCLSIQRALWQNCCITFQIIEGLILKGEQHPWPKKNGKK